MLATLKLDPARTEFISKFVDTYLRLNQVEEQIFRAEFDKLEPVERETIMQTITSWEEKGIHALSSELVQSLGEALLEFETLTDLTTWLDR